MAQTKPKAGQFYGVSDNGTDGEFLQTDGTGGMTWASPITNPTITSIDYPGTATAANPAGGESVIINGTLFASGITCTVGGTTVTTVFNSATQITINTPAKTAGAYTVAVTNSDGGTASQANFIQYSGIPIWTTSAGNIGSVQEGLAASFQVTATEGSDTIEYTVTTGALPTGLSLATATGAITGTAGSVSADTTTTFSITAKDDENQTSAVRSFNIIVTNDAPSNHFNTVLYTGNGGTQSISSLNFAPGLVWIKTRSNVDGHFLFDTQRGVREALQSDSTTNQFNRTSLTAFNSNGFTLGNYGGTNTNSYTYASWNFKAGGAAVANTDGNINSQVSVNNALGFSIVKYNGNQTAGASIGHGLDVAPSMVIMKNINRNGYGWLVYHEAVSPNASLTLNNTDYANTGIGYFNNTATSATTFTLGSDGFGNYNGDDYIAYCFSNKTGFSKTGSYTGNGGENIVETGFEPAFLLTKSVTTTGGWIIWDNKRTPSNRRNLGLFPATSAVEYAYPDTASGPGGPAFYANGFSFDNNDSDYNGNGITYSYLAIAADGSTSSPTLANSFATETYNGNGSNISITTGFKPDMVWMKARTVAYDPGLVDSVRGKTSMLLTSSGALAQSRADLIQSYDTNGYTWGSNNKGNAATSYVSWSWKGNRIPTINTTGTITGLVSANQAAGFSIIKYNGATNATADADNNSGAYWSLGHELGATPDLVIVKKINGAGDWYAGGAALGSTGVNGNHLVLSGTATQGAEPNILWGGPQTFNSTTFGLGAWDIVNRNGDSYIAYCWRSIAGYSKVGTYTGTGGVNTVSMGFAPSFGLIKRTNSTGSWRLFDTNRGTDKSISINSSAAEYDDSSNYLDFTSTGFYFSASQANADINASGGTYVYIAIKEN